MVIIIDTREQKPFAFSPDVTVRRKKLDCGDYSIGGMESLVRIERKAPSEIWSMVGSRMDFFLNQLDRLARYPIRALLIEGELTKTCAPPSFTGVSVGNFSFRLMRWTVERGIPVWFLGERSRQSMHLIEDLFAGILRGYQYRRGFRDQFAQGETSHDGSSTH